MRMHFMFTNFFRYLQNCVASSTRSQHNYCVCEKCCCLSSDVAIQTTKNVVYLVEEPAIAISRRADARHRNENEIETMSSNTTKNILHNKQSKLNFATDFVQ